MAVDFLEEEKAMSQAAPAGAPGGAPGGGPRQMVVISVVDGQIRVDPDRFEISKCNQEEVLWVATDPDLEFTVEFEKGDSPFYEFQFSNDFPASGLVRRSVLADPQRAYKYTVRAEKLEKDPTGVITK
jgi:hypothetical protein